MNIVIVGAGVVGRSLAEQLSVEGHRVSIIDKDRRKIRELGEALDVLSVHGNAGMPSVLQRAGIKSSQMVIAVTDVDEVNLVVGMLATRLGVEHTIVRIRNPEYIQKDGVLSLQELGISHVINPDPAIVEALARMIEIPGSNDIAILAQGKILILGFDIPTDSPAVGLTMAELKALGSLEHFLVLFISRNGAIMVPRGGDQLQANDRVHLLVSSRTVELILPVIHKTIDRNDVVIVSGATRIGVQLARAMEERIEKVVLIEPDRELAEEAAAHLKKTLVLHGDPRSLEVLEEASIEKCDLFCAVSDDDQGNVLAALLAKKYSSTQTAVLVHQPEFVPVLQSLGIHIVINPRLVTVGEILMHVRRGHVHSVTRLTEGRAEIIEMDVPEGSPAVDVMLKEIEFPQNALLGAIIHDGVMRIPNGESVIKAGDTIVIFALPEAIPRIEKLFTKRKWF